MPDFFLTFIELEFFGKPQNDRLLNRKKEFPLTGFRTSLNKNEYRLLVKMYKL